MNAMKIKATPLYEEERDETVIHYAKRCLNRSDYHAGQMESMQANSDNITSAFGRLLELLASKGVLTAPEITGIVERWENEHATFLP